MKIYIDADGCPVVRHTLRIAKQFAVPCVILCDTAHRIEHEGTETIVVAQGADSVDFRLVNLIAKDDIVITQDYGLAAAIGIVVFIVCATISLIVYNNSKSMKDEEAFS